MTARDAYRKLPRWCMSGRHWLTKREDVADRCCQPCRRERHVNYWARRAGRPVCWACKQRVGTYAGYGTSGPVCHHCRDEFDLLDALYRSITQERRKGRQPLLTHCPEGHPYDASNTEVVILTRPRVKLQRHCRICKRASWHRRMKAAKLADFRAIVQAARVEAAA